ncbi:MAG: tRNA 2-selenouridine(34) synthase MnmH [SAR324 cluster bacterium]|jgi:tRNA 2-selenouridine synthase|nr:tRNA 2-selenouridine(34) synthase MnmH [SAR324 cluster bacterium]
MINSDSLSAQAKPSSKRIEDFLKGGLPALSVEEALAEDMLLLDVRTAEEFAKGSIPGARSFPLFDDLERAEIGTIYKKVGRDAAVVKGLEFFEPRLQQFLLSLSAIKPQQLVVYCARGGMRSASVVRLLEENGFRVSQMQGGYKYYRQFVLQQLENSTPPLIVLHGQTGVGKTLILQKLPDHLDLEGLAQHRSSLFGAIHKTPRTQKDFEALLVNKLSQLPEDRFLFVEGESRKVGQVFIPQSFANAMKSGILVLLKASLETRISRIVEEYNICDEQSIQQIDSILQSLKVALGKVKVEQLRLWLKQGEIENIVHMLLVDYYDPRYQHAMSGYDFELELSAEDLKQAAGELITFRNQMIVNHCQQSVSNVWLSFI